jgi:hypothetical protein
MIKTPNMMSKITILALGVFILSDGVYFVFYRQYYHPSISPVDMGTYHWLIGIVFVFGGLYFVYSAAKLIAKDIRNKRKGRPPGAPGKGG